MLSRAFSDDPLDDCVPQEEKSLIGVRKFTNTGTIVIRLARQRNLEGMYT